MEHHTTPKLNFEQIRQWKNTDIRAQVVAFVVPLLIAGFTATPDIAFLAYFSVGAVQIVSCIANKAYLHEKIHWRTRKYYEYTLLVVFLLAGGLLATMSEAFLMFAAAMLIIGPIMAIWYFAFITLGEHDLIKGVLKAKREEEEQAIEFS